jgi:hypothetical protein
VTRRPAYLHEGSVLVSDREQGPVEAQLRAVIGRKLFEDLNKIRSARGVSAEACKM